MSELEAAGTADFEAAGLTAVAAVVAGALGVAFAAGAAAGVLAADVDAGAVAGVLAAVVSAASFLLLRDFLLAVADVSLLAAGVLAAGVLAAVVSAAPFFLLDFFDVVAEVSLAADVLDVLVSVAFLLFFDFFLVVVVLLVSLELACAAAITGMKARANAKDNTAIHSVSLYREFIISLYPHK